MKEQLIVLQQQMIYPEKRGNNTMSNGTTSPEEQRQLTPEEQMAELARRKQEVEQLKKKEEERKAQKGMWKHVKKEALEKRDAGRAKEVDREVKAAEDKDKAPKTGEKTPKKYFKEIPQPLQTSIDNFCKNAEWIDLEHLDTEFLTYHYLSLRKEAEGKGIKDFTFLSKIEEELNSSKRGNLKVVEIAEESDMQLNIPQKGIAGNEKEFEAAKRYWNEQVIKKFVTKEEAEARIAQRFKAIGGGSLDLDTITDTKLLSYGQAINDQIEIIGENYDILNSRYGEIVALNGEVNQEQKRELLKQISQAMKSAGEKRHEAEEDRPRGSWYEERRITGTERKDMNKQIDKILEGVPGAREDLEKLFNRLFDYTDSNPLEEFDKALGAAGSQEHLHWVNMLNVLKGEAAGNTAKVDLINSLIQRYSNEYELRKLLHNSYWIVETGGDPKNFVEYSSQFLSHYLDLVLSESPEVEVAYRIREQVLYQIKRENNGTIPPEMVEFIAKEDPTGKMVFQSEFEKRSVELFRKVIKTTKIFGEGNMPDWRIDRALSVSRGIGMVLLRWPEIIAECTLQAPEETNESQPSIPWEKLAWELNPLDHKIKRYRVAREMRAILYSAVNRKKGKGMWNQDELKDSMNLAAITALSNMDGENRMIDLRNLTRIGGWATYSGWRSWVAALEREGGDVSLAVADLQKNLSINPGMALRLLWNRYEYKDMGELKKKFLKEHGWTQGLEEDSREVVKAWENYQKTHKSSKEWSQADIETWKKSAERIPHVILRVITDETNKIMSKAQAKALISEIFAGVADVNLKKVYTQAEEDLTIAKEIVMKKRRDLRAANPKAEFKEDKITLPDLKNAVERTRTEGETDDDINKRIERAWKLKQVVERELNKEELQKKLFDKMGSREFAFAITTEDLPLGEFRFVQTGARGLVTRRNNDFLQEIQANAAIEELLKSFNIYQSPEQVVEQLVKIFKFAEVHDYDRAFELIEFLSKGIIRMCQKDGAYKVPILGEITALADFLFKKRGQSYAQTAYGPTAMAWDSDDIYNFTEHLRKTIFIGEPGREVLDRIRKETGGTIWHAIGKKSKVAIYLLMLFMSYEMIEKLIKGK